LRPLDPQAGALGRELACLQAVCASRTDDAPVLQTIFSPFTVARKLAGPELVSQTMRHDPQRLHAALGVIAETIHAYALACLEAGADGLFFATQAATPEVLSPENHETFVEPYDLRVLGALSARQPIILLHLHGRQPYLTTLASRYPVQALNWHDRRTTPTLAQAMRQVPQTLVGGLDERGVLIHGTGEAIRAQAQDAVRQCGGHRLILSPGCVLDLQVPESNLALVREAVEDLRHH
jgi:uroporphyrinogen decarboxylase